MQGAGWSPEFHQFNLNVTQFPTVFRWLDLPAAVPSAKGPQANGTVPAQPKATQKKGPQPPLSKNHTADSWRNDPTGRGSSLLEGDRASGITNGFDARSAVSSNSKAPSSQKSATVPCRFFQKVFAPHQSVKYCTNNTRASAASVTNVTSCTRQQPRLSPRRKSQFQIQIASQTALASPSSSPPAQHPALYLSTSTPSAWTRTCAHPASRNGPYTTRASTSKNPAIISTSNAHAALLRVRTTTTSSSPSRATCSSTCSNPVRVLIGASVGRAIASTDMFAKRMVVRGR